MDVRTVTVTTSDGVPLEADLALPPDPSVAVALAHPHPQYGGTRTAGIIDHLFRVLPGSGVAVIRWDFRGAGGSGGSHGGGEAERLDVVAAIDALVGEIGDGRPLHLIGWSFGADVSLSVDDARIAGWVGLAPPLNYVADPPAAGADDRPTLLLVPEHDQFRQPASAISETEEWTATTVRGLPGTDHFLGGAAGRITDAVLEHLGV